MTILNEVILAIPQRIKRKTRGLVRIGYPSEAHLKLKSRKISLPRFYRSDRYKILHMYVTSISVVKSSDFSSQNMEVFTQM